MLHAEAVKRGACWVELAKRMAIPQERRHLATMLSGVFSRHFHVEPFPEAIEAWIESLIHISDSSMGRRNATEPDDHSPICSEAVIRNPAKYLRDPSEEVRCAALHYLDSCELAPEILEEILHIAKNPVSVSCQITACSLIGMIGHRIPAFSRGIRCLALIVLDESLSLLVRDTAYQSLHEAAGSPVEQWPCVLEAEGDYSFPESVDWNFVGRMSQASPDSGGAV